MSYPEYHCSSHDILRELYDSSYVDKCLHLAAGRWMTQNEEIIFWSWWRSTLKKGTYYHGICVCVCLCFQRITGSTLGHKLKMFGQSLSSGIDIDDNGYQGEMNFLTSHTKNKYKCDFTQASSLAKLSLSSVRCGCWCISFGFSCCSQVKQEWLSFLLQHFSIQCVHLLGC